LLIFYLQLIGAFDTLHGFAVGEETENLEVAPRTGWAAEAAGWTKTYEKVTGKSIDEDVQEPSNDPLKFWIFSNACVSPKKWLEAPTNEDDSYRIYLSDSSRTRKDVLEHIFKPLLGDVFAFNVVQQTFESLGIKRDYQYLLKVSNTVDTSRFFNAILLTQSSVLWRVVHDAISKKRRKESAIFSAFADNPLAPTHCWSPA
jgi:hypothetical protein